MQQNKKEAAPSPCVEFVYRVYEDGRRERFATVLVPTPDGAMIPAAPRPTGPLGQFVRAAISEWRRVGIEPQGDTRGYRRRW